MMVIMIMMMALENHEGNCDDEDDVDAGGVDDDTE